MTAPIFSMIFISRQFTLQTVDLIHYNLVLSLFTDEEPESPRSVNKSEESVDPSDVNVTEKTETEEGKTEEVKERGGAEGGQSEEEQNDEKENGMRLKYISIYMYNQTHFMV
jgi:phosphatidylserine decarboxylase